MPPDPRNVSPDVQLWGRPQSPSQVQPEYVGRLESRTGLQLAELRRLADWMDSAFRIPGTNLTFGVDALLGLLPGFGDTATSVISLCILHAASRRGVPRLTMTRMAANIAIDYLVGAVPIVGDLFDVCWKANQKNVDLIERHIAANPAAERRLRLGDRLFFAALAAILLIFLVGCVTIAVMIIGWIGSQFAARSV